MGTPRPLLRTLTPIATVPPMTVARPLWLLLLLIPLAACGPKAPTDALDNARNAVDGAADSSRCAEAEFRAAESLLRQAEEAYENRDFARARQLAEAAEVQAARARRVAEENLEDCERVESATFDTVDDADDDHDRGWAIDDASLDRYTLGPVHFAFDSYAIEEEARAILDQHAQWLEDNADRRVIIQGHTDDRGSSEYNLALGERRARAVRTYLDRLGIAEERMTIISFGMEMPVGTHDENRRVDFVLRQ